MSFTYGIEKPNEKPGRRQSLLEDLEDSSDDDDKTKEMEEEALRHWTLEVADESIQHLISSIRCDERLDALEDLNESCSLNAASSQQLNSEMDELEKQLCKEWQDISAGPKQMKQHVHACPKMAHPFRHIIKYHILSIRAL